MTPPASADSSNGNEGGSQPRIMDDGLTDETLQVDPEAMARSYQLEALEKALKQNTVAFLETGSGKTLIAIMLIRAHAHMLRKSSGFIAVFLVPTVVLVTQQARVIEKHTDLKVGTFYGEMGVDFWSAATWNQQLQQFEVFVMTPQILLDNLRHRFFKLERIKLLIFDECHHARGKHAYACIMREFYHRQLLSGSADLPRIFGMTASVIKKKVSQSRSDYAKQILELETLMNSKVYTVANESVLAHYISFASPKVKLYKHKDIPSALFKSVTARLEFLKNKYLGDLLELGPDHLVGGSERKKILKLHAAFLYCLTEMGLWLAAKAAELLSCEENYIFFWGMKVNGSELTGRKFSQDAFQIFSLYFPSGHCIGRDLTGDVDLGLVTTKVHFLIQSLMDYRKINDLRCIIFVERVITAMVLPSLLSKIGQLSGWGIEHMAGNSCCLQSQTRKEQIKIVDAFCEGKVNIIVATQILEEGLDVRNCNLVVRFDPCPTVCSFIQSRGRARMPGSDYLLIIRSDDVGTLSKVASFLNSGDIMREESLQHASLPCQPIKDELYHEEYYCVETTGAIVTLASSVALIYFYCSKLPSDSYYKPLPTFEIDENICILNLPKSSPVQTVKVEGRRNVLKQLACLEACQKLHKFGALTDTLLPKLEMEDENDSLEIETEPYQLEQVDYFPGALVSFWSSFSRQGLYYCYKITLNQSFNHIVSPSDIFLVVKSYLGSDFIFNSFILEADRGPISVRLEYVEIIHLSFQQVLMARKFQSCVLGIIMHHDFSRLMKTVNYIYKQEAHATVVYLLLPSTGGKVDWHCIESANFSKGKATYRREKQHCASKQSVELLRTKDLALCSCRIQYSVVYAPHNGRFYYITGILDKLNGNSTMCAKNGEVLTYADHFRSRHGIKLAWEDQPLLAGRCLFHARSFLLRRSVFKERGFTNVGVELPPELCVVIMSSIPMNTLYSFSFVPSIMHRIQCMLLATRLKKIRLDHCVRNATVPATMLLEAITTKKCQEGFSLESLETLGDSFLKHAATLHVFKSYKHHHHVGILSKKREKIISNASLCRLGCARNIPVMSASNKFFKGFIRTEEFEPKKWMIPGDCAMSFDENEAFLSEDVYSAGTRHIKSKVVADCTEALVGAYLSSGGEMAAFAFLQWLGINLDIIGKQTTAETSPVVARPEVFVNIKALEALLRYTFSDPSLLVEALTHGSYQVKDNPSCYEKLEFLGDAVLDCLITTHLYGKYPGLTPGLLTDLRSASVNNNCYAHAAVKAGLHKHVLHASPELHRQINFCLNNHADSFMGSSYGWEAGIALPKVLADVIESLAGAIFVDSGFDKEAVWKSMRPLLEPMVSPETIERHPVRELAELCSRKAYSYKFTLTFKDRVASISAQVDADGTLYEASATSTNQKSAKKLAAKAVLEDLRAGIAGYRKNKRWMQEGHLPL